MIQTVRKGKATNTTIVAIRADSPAVIATIIERLCDQSLRTDAFEVLQRRSIFTLALAQAVAGMKGGASHDLFFIVMSDADMLMLRMMDVQIVAHCDYKEFCEMPNHPDLAPLQRVRERAVGNREKRQVNQRFQEFLGLLLLDVVK